jgi:hypothetical protein
VAIPAEHGGWSFLLEPIVLGLFVAPSLPGLWLGVGVVFAFLTRHPLKLVLSDRRRGRRLARTAAAERFALIYGAITVLGVGLALAFASVDAFVPLLFASPLFALQAYFDATNRSRTLAAELIGAVALAAAAASIALAGGWSPEQAYPLWGILVARAVPSVLYVRARLRLERGQAPDRILPMLAHGVALTAGIWLVLARLTPPLSAAGLVLLLLRAIYGLSPYRRGHLPRHIGLQELALGIIVVVLIALGYIL